MKTECPPAGYIHPDYARSLVEFGEAVRLPESGGWLLSRAIGKSPLRDATSVYPLLVCRDSTKLDRDIHRIRDLVSVTAVTDPFAPVTVAELRKTFPDLVRPFKEHFIVDLHRMNLSKHRLASLRQVLRGVRVEVPEEPRERLDDWMRLYGELCARKRIRGVQAFSRESFLAHLGLPGCVGLVGLVGGRCVSMSLWYLMGDVAYYHLAASDEDGYRASASHALVYFAMTRFAEHGMRWLSLGGTAGVTSGAEDGLTRFKRRWATGTRTTYLCGRIIRAEEYRSLSGTSPTLDPPYFPAYRAGEFA